MGCGESEFTAPDKWDCLWVRITPSFHGQSPQQTDHRTTAFVPLMRSFHNYRDCL